VSDMVSPETVGMPWRVGDLGSALRSRPHLNTG
jgi:hypothetical protein